jgi:hypothetical protein
MTTYQENDETADAVVEMLLEAQDLMDQALLVLEHAERTSRNNGGPYWLHGQLEAYTIPTLRTFAGDQRYQAGCIGGLLASIEQDELEGEEA